MRNRLALLAVALALVIAYVGLVYRIPAIITLVFVGAGLFGIGSGVQMILTRRADIPTSTSLDPLQERHTGISAQLWGVLFVGFGVFLSAVGLLAAWITPAQVSAWLNQALSTPLGMGVLFLAIGAGIAIYGGTRLLAGPAAFVETKLPLLDRILGGIWFVVLGLAFLAVGGLLIWAPDLLRGIVNQLGRWIEQQVRG